MVAKSYQELEIVGDVFVSSGRQYVNVKLKSGKLKTFSFATIPHICGMKSHSPILDSQIS